MATSLAASSGSRDCELHKDNRKTYNSGRTMERSQQRVITAFYERLLRVHLFLTYCSLLAVRRRYPSAIPSWEEQRWSTSLLGFEWRASEVEFTVVHSERLWGRASSHSGSETQARCMRHAPGFSGARIDVFGTMRPFCSTEMTSSLPHGRVSYSKYLVAELQSSDYNDFLIRTTAFLRTRPRLLPPSERDIYSGSFLPP